MKFLMKLLCLLTIAFCIYFPITYFHSVEDKREVKLSMILTDKRDDIFIAKQELDEGKPFNEVAKKYSKEYKDAGLIDLGYFGKYNKLGEVISKDVFSRKLNEYTEPFETDWGWAIFKITDISYFSDKKHFDEKYYYTKN